MKNKFFAVLVMAVIAFYSCEVSPSPSGDQINSSELVFGFPSGTEGAKSVSTTFETGYTAWVRAFDSNRNRVAIGGAGVYNVTLSWDSSISKWKGSLNLSTVSGEITFLAVVFDSSSKVQYRGSQTITISDANRNTAITLGAALTFSLGDVGPGGGYIFYDKESYGSDGWRYLEAAPADFSFDWTSTYIDSGYIVNNGDVYEDKAPTGYGAEDVLVYTKKDFYWGPAGTLGTQASLGEGTPNFVLLDAATTATPILRDGKGRKTIVNPDNPRRDTPECLKAQALNGLTDWFVPSESELAQMYANKSNVPGLSSSLYWSSTESSTTTYDEIYKVNIPDAKAVDMSALSLTVSNVSRDTVKFVRPSRRF
jgi:hypothetical protein